MTLCQECPKKSECVKLCAEAELYVNQDYVGLMELPISGAEYGEVEYPDTIKTIMLTKTERKILTLLKKSVSHEELCYILDISISCLHSHLYNLRKKQ